ncbi:hypothetical protein CLV58_101196 [Spirosoma oryzae]|uniref:Uncharacterized protein n=1 Tax=Spirosoma oryzae TaxID=1469603 RepID=A0A2T0TN39_9BACT|nr:hypothetical protein [Spirosoma oryzae]PRY47130.1 hypothetical protein CLV58_101196 [Spirosoma oryzae]
MSQPITRRAMFAEIHQELGLDGKPNEFSLRYCRKDGSIGFKPRCRKTTKSTPGAGKFRANVSGNHLFLVEDVTTREPFNVLIDLILEYNGRRVNHTF